MLFWWYGSVVFGEKIQLTKMYKEKIGFDCMELLISPPYLRVTVSGVMQIYLKYVDVYIQTTQCVDNMFLIHVTSFLENENKRTYSYLLTMD
jgi:hypothetical protein